MIMLAGVPIMLPINPTERWAALIVAGLQFATAFILIGGAVLGWWNNRK